MSLYLTVFRAGEEVEGWVLGRYGDFGYFRDAIAKHLGAADFPALMEHSDCDGEWGVADLPALKKELRAIGEAFKSLPPEAITGAFGHTQSHRRDATSLYDCFHNVDGENLFRALLDLCDVALDLGEPVLLQ